MTLRRQVYAYAFLSFGEIAYPISFKLQTFNKFLRRHVTSKWMIGICGMLLNRNLSRDREKSIWFSRDWLIFETSNLFLEKSNMVSRNIQQLTCCLWIIYIVLTLIETTSIDFERWKVYLFSLFSWKIVTHNYFYNPNSNPNLTLSQERCVWMRLLCLKQWRMLGSLA